MRKYMTVKCIRTVVCAQLPVMYTCNQPRGRMPGNRHKVHRTQDIVHPYNEHGWRCYYNICCVPNDDICGNHDCVHGGNAEGTGFIQNTDISQGRPPKGEK